MTDGLALYGRDLFGEPIRPTASGPLAARFLFPPFSVLDARSGPWQDRKRAWISLGIRSEVGRAGGLTYSIPMSKWNPNEMSTDYYGEEAQRFSTSIFDPVLCEVAYRWWAPEGGVVLDPFAGGSVRGIVASALGLSYIGIDLSAEQVAANREQAAAIGTLPVPEWTVGDSREILPELRPARADFVLTCPPYGDLERYSDDPRDLSTMSYRDFVEALAEILAGAAGILRSDRFAAIVVGDFRDSRGIYRGFPSDTIAAAEAAGLELYNEAILLTTGSHAMRAGRSFPSGRKLVKTHQNVLVFVKGDPRAAAAAARPVPPPEEEI